MGNISGVSKQNDVALCAPFHLEPSEILFEFQDSTSSYCPSHDASIAWVHAECLSIKVCLDFPGIDSPRSKEEKKIFWCWVETANIDHTHSVQSKISALTIEVY